MPRLNQVNALVTGKKGETQKSVTELYNIVKKKELFDGLERVYRPLDDQSNETLPPESKKVQRKAKTMLKEFAEKTTVLVDLIATQDYGNQQARADIVIEGEKTPLLIGVPVTTLLVLEKQVNDWITYVSHFHTPEASEEWSFDPQSDLLKTGAVKTMRTKKIPRNHVKQVATEHHPAQVEVYTEDVQVGTWSLVSYTGRLGGKEKNEILVRLEKLRDAIKVAREQANAIDVKMQKLGEALFAYAFGDATS
jgi:hypothetical protein